MPETVDVCTGYHTYECLPFHPNPLFVRMISRFSHFLSYYDKCGGGGGGGDDEMVFLRYSCFLRTLSVLGEVHKERRGREILQVNMI